MNIFHKVALQGLRKNRTRTFATVIGVALSATLFTTVAVFGTSLLQYMINVSAAKCGNWSVDFVDVDSDFVKERMRHLRNCQLHLFPADFLKMIRKS